MPRRKQPCTGCGIPCTSKVLGQCKRCRKYPSGDSAYRGDEDISESELNRIIAEQLPTMPEDDRLADTPLECLNDPNRIYADYIPPRSRVVTSDRRHNGCPIR